MDGRVKGADSVQASSATVGGGAAARQTPDESTLLLPTPTGSEPSSRAESNALASVRESDSRLLPGESLAGRFTILRFIAQGGMGAVYEANDVILRSRVALKVIHGRISTDAAAMERFRREVLLARRVGHPNVCRVYELYDSTTAAGVHIHFLTMELLEGETLSRRIARQGGLTTDEALPLVRQLCEGLAAAHAEGVIHRDFKSSNVMLVSQREASGDSTPQSIRAVITDFGIARAEQLGSGKASDGPLTGGGAFLGTPEYMAPEQVTGGTVTAATDIYALGIVLYEMLTGTLPFTGDTPLAAAAKRLNEAPPRPEAAVPGLDARWSATVLRCLAREPSRRFQHAADVAAALAQDSLRPRWSSRVVVMLGALSVGVASALVVRGWRVEPRATSVKAAATVPSVAVLPFVDMSPQHDQEYLSEGVAEEIIGALAEVPGLKVVARSSSFSFKGKNEDVRSVGEKLNVAHVLEGSVRKSAGRLRVTAQLVNTADGYQLWSQTFERETGDIFAVQDEVARAVVNTLKVKVLPDWRRSSSDRGTSPEAYAAYLRGLQFLRTGDHRKAIDEFRTAMELDPNYAPAHASFAKSLLFFSFYSTGKEVIDTAWRRHSLDAAEKAVALDPRLPDAYVARAISRHDAWDWPGALSDLEEALALAPSNADALSWRSTVLGNVGRASDALADARLAVSIDPLSAQAHYALGYQHRSLGQYSDARASFERSRALAPGLADATLQLGHLELLTGNPSKALAIFETAPQEWAKLTGLALAQHSLGNEAASRQALAQLIARYSAGSQYQIAEAYAWRGDRDQALQWLERAYVERDPGIPGILTEPFFRPLNDDPRFEALVAKMKLPSIR